MNPLHGFSQIAIKRLDHPILFSNLILGGVAMLAVGFAFPQAGLHLSLFILLVYVVAASLNTYRLVQQRLVDHQRQMQSLFALQQLLDLRAPLPSLTGWAASPELLTQILIQIKRNKPGLVVELGSGASTIAIPYMLEKWGNGSILSIDHDAAFARLTQNSLDLHEIDCVTLVVTPLVPQQVDGHEYSWYDLSTVTFSQKINMVLVDGPPVKTNPLARYPALPLLWDHLAEDALILMDDADRADEQEIIRRWTRDYPIDILPSAASLKGFTVLQVRKIKSGA